MCGGNMEGFGGKECKLDVIMMWCIMYTAFKRHVKNEILILFYYTVKTFKFILIF